MSEFLEPSFFEGGRPQSRANPGDTERELVHEIRNLNTALSMLQSMFQQFLPVLEALSELDEKLHHLEITPPATAEPVAPASERDSDASDHT